VSSPPRPSTNSGVEPNIQSEMSTWCEVNSATMPPEKSRYRRQLAQLLLPPGYMVQRLDGLLTMLRCHWQWMCFTSPSTFLSTMSFTAW